MPLNAAELEVVRRSHTGVRGFLDFQDAGNADGVAAFAPILERAGKDLELSFANMLQAGKFAVAAELRVRESQRLAVVGRGDELSGPKVPYNAQAIRSAQRGLTMIRRARGALDQDPLVDLREAHRDPDVLAAIEEGKEAIVTHLVKFNIDVEGFEELLGIWDEHAKVASESGVEGLLGRIDEHLERFIELRGEDDRGTRPHSPLPWWKWVLIGWLISSAIFCIIACFVWFGCTWVWAALGAMAAIVFGIYDRGC
jgi:hypothetical protein